MKKVIVTLALLTPLALLAQTNAPVNLPTVVSGATGSVQSLMLAVLPFLVPLIIALAKMEIPKLPSWVLPILAPLLSAAIDWLTSIATGGHATPVVAALLGSSGVGLREIYDQVKGRIQPEAKP